MFLGVSPAITAGTSLAKSPTMTISRPLLSLMTVAALAATPGCAPPTPGTTDAPGHLEGHVRAYVLDNADGTSLRGFALESSPGRYVELAPHPDLAKHVGQHVVIESHDLAEPPSGHVQADTRRVAVDAIAMSARGVTEQALVGGGKPTTAHVAVVLLDFQGVTPQPFTQADAKVALARVHDYYKEISYGSWTVQIDVFGPYAVPKPADCSLDTIGNLARQAAKGAGVAIDGYDHVGITLPDNKPSGLDCACGLAWVGHAPAVPNPQIQGTSIYTCRGDNAFAHEMGHGFGLDHASKALCNGQAMRRDPYTACMIDEYGNHFNVMGNGLGHMNGFQKSTMKWLDDCNTVRVSKDDVFELVPIQMASNAIQTLQIATGDVKDGNPLYYYVEYRNPAKATFNAEDNGVVRELGPGVHIDVAPSFTAAGGDHRVLLLDLSQAGDFGDPRLTPGRSFSDPDGRVTVSVMDASTDSAHVKVTFPKGGAGSNTCANGAIPPTTGGPTGAGALYQDCPFSGWTVALAPGDYNAAALAALGAIDNDASSLWLADGYEATLFDGPDLTGNSVKLTASSTCLVSQNFNDVLSSIRIVAVSTGAGGKGGSGGSGAAGSTGGSGTAGSTAAGKGGMTSAGQGGMSAGTAGKSGSGSNGGVAGSATSAGSGGAPKGTGGSTAKAGAGGASGHSAGTGGTHATAGAGGSSVLGAAGSEGDATTDSSGGSGGCTTSAPRGSGSEAWLFASLIGGLAARRRRR